MQNNNKKNNLVFYAQSTIAVISGREICRDRDRQSESERETNSNGKTKQNKTKNEVHKQMVSIRRQCSRRLSVTHVVQFVVETAGVTHGVAVGITSP